jgi:hypothetical protein
VWYFLPQKQAWHSGVIKQQVTTLKSELHKIKMSLFLKHKTKSREGRKSKMIKIFLWTNQGP